MEQQEEAIQQQLWAVATAVRDACFATAVQAYQDAANDGLCHEGAWECAIEALKMVKIEALLGQINQ